MRWHILRTLLYKELLRYRYNWGMLALVAALLALTIITSISSRAGALPGQDEDLKVSDCHICYDGTSPNAVSWANHLRQHPPVLGNLPIYHDLLGETTQRLLNDDARALVIEFRTDGAAKR